MASRHRHLLHRIDHHHVIAMAILVLLVHYQAAIHTTIIRNSAKYNQRRSKDPSTQHIKSYRELPATALPARSVNASIVPRRNSAL